MLDAEGGGVRAFGRVCFEGVTPLGYDIMGPFCLVPGMECRHKVVSMRHRVQGELNINGRRYVFDDGAGYLEGDRGCSFRRNTKARSKKYSFSLLARLNYMAALSGNIPPLRPRRSLPSSRPCLPAAPSATWRCRICKTTWRLSCR